MVVVPIGMGGENVLSELVLLGDGRLSHVPVVLVVVPVVHGLFVGERGVGHGPGGIAIERVFLCQGVHGGSVDIGVGDRLGGNLVRVIHIAKRGLN